MQPRTCLLLGMGCLVAAQAVASWWCVPQRGELTPNRDVYEALTPGELAGTLMLGGFRGLACDLLWLRADSAKTNGRFYESVALFEAISRIQPRFEQPWQFMAWDLAYNLSHEVEDRDAKWSWVIAGIDTNIRGVVRNPQSERLLRHLAWMFHHKGDLFHDKIESVAWASRLNPLFAEINARSLAGFHVELLPEGTGLSNFTLSARLYQACVALTDGNTGGKNKLTAQFVRRMVPLGLESDGNLKRNQSRHLEALKRYLDALQAWEPVIAWGNAPGANPSDANQRSVTRESVERNEGRLRRKAAQFCYDLAPDSDTGEKAAQAILARNWSEALRHLQRPGWKLVASSARIRWLDEP